MMTNKRLLATAAAVLLTLALGACGGSDNRGLGNGRVDDSSRSEFVVKSLRGGISSTVKPDVLTHNENGLVALHQLRAGDP